MKHRTWLRCIAAGLTMVPGCAVTEVAKPHPISAVPPAAAKPERISTSPETLSIDLPTAFRLADGGNPRINLSRERVQEALAGQTAARAMLLPNLSAGASINVHQGPLQRSSGSILDVSRQSAYFGNGAFLVGSGTVAVPGVRLFTPLADAIYEPLAARQIVTSRRADANAAENDILLRVATAYLALVGAESRLDILRQGQRDIGDVVRLTTAYARAGQGRTADAKRAEANADLVLRRVQETEGEVLAASARLAELLSLDPTTRLQSPDRPDQPLAIFTDVDDLEGLLQLALAARPEVAARSADVMTASTRTRQERVRPWLPTISAGFSAGGFGGGSLERPENYNTYRARTDFDAFAVWSLQNLGVGNVSRGNRATAVLAQAIAEYDRTTNQIRREVTDSVAAVRAASAQAILAREAVKFAEDGFEQEMLRIRQGQGLPLEVLDSFRQLLDSRLELNRAILAFDLAQFRLLVSLGTSPLAPPNADPGPASVGE